MPDKKAEAIIAKIRDAKWNVIIGAGLSRNNRPALAHWYIASRPGHADQYAEANTELEAATELARLVGVELEDG